MRTQGLRISQKLSDLEDIILEEDVSGEIEPLHYTDEGLMACVDILMHIVSSKVWFKKKGIVTKDDGEELKNFASDLSIRIKELTGFDTKKYYNDSYQTDNSSDL